MKKSFLIVGALAAILSTNGYATTDSQPVSVVCQCTEPGCELVNHNYSQYGIDTSNAWCQVAHGVEAGKRCKDPDCYVIRMGETGPVIIDKTSLSDDPKPLEQNGTQKRIKNTSVRAARTKPQTLNLVDMTTSVSIDQLEQEKLSTDSGDVAYNYYCENPGCQVRMVTIGSTTTATCWDPTGTIENCGEIKVVRTTKDRSPSPRR